MEVYNEILGREIATSAAICGLSKHQSSRGRVWLVDDNARLRSLLASLLDEEGFECERGFSNPDEALAALASGNSPDIILLDIEMGEYNGLDAIRPIKSRATDTHVLMLTTFAMPGARERAFREGASDFMLKSMSPTEIASRMQRAMEFGTVAGLLTAFLSSGSSIMEKTVAPNATATAPSLTLAERWMTTLRGFWKLSPS